MKEKIVKMLAITRPYFKRNIVVAGGNRKEGTQEGEDNGCYFLSLHKILRKGRGR